MQNLAFRAPWNRSTGALLLFLEIHTTTRRLVPSILNRRCL